MVSFADGKDAGVADHLGGAGDSDTRALGMAAGGLELLNQFIHAGIGEHVGISLGFGGIEGGGGQLVVEHSAAANDRVVDRDADA